MPLNYSDKVIVIVTICEKLQTLKNRQCVVIFPMAKFDEDCRHIASAEEVRDVPLGKFNDSRSKFQSSSKAN